MDPDLIIPDSERSLEEGAIKPWGGPKEQRVEYTDLIAFCRRNKIPTDLPFRRLAEDQKKAIIDGTDDYYGIRGFFRWLESKTYKMHVRVYLSRYRTYRICPDCRGTRFREDTLLYRLIGLNIAEIYALNVNQALDFFRRSMQKAQW